MQTFNAASFIVTAVKYTAFYLLIADRYDTQEVNIRFPQDKMTLMALPKVQTCIELLV